MKKPLPNTKCTVKLRKSEYREEWYLIIESYPVFAYPGAKPSRHKEALNRTVTTPVWDKSRPSRPKADGSVSYKPKRDINGVIVCRSDMDNEACRYADKVRALRQREYDNAALYTDNEAEQAAQNERSMQNFIPYFKQVSEKRHRNSSDSIIINWGRVYELLKIYANGDTILFRDIDLSMIENFKFFVLYAPKGGNKSGTISQNTASTYFAIFKAGLKQAFVDGYLTVDLSAKVKGIPEEESRREHLTIGELNILAHTPCAIPVVKRAALFSALTGLRHVDIKLMTWQEVIEDGDHYRLDFTQRKTHGVEYMPISSQAYQLCGERLDGKQLVFEGLPDPSWISKPLQRWIQSAGITKHITFHCSSHNKIF